MVDFNDYDYSSLDPNSKIGKLAARADKDTSGKIDSSEEKSIFLNGAKNLVKQGKLEDSIFKNIFGVEYSEDLKYDSEEVDNDSSSGGDDGKTKKNSKMILSYSASDKVIIKQSGNAKGAKLFRLLDDANGHAVWFGKGGHERAEILLNKMNEEATPLEFAHLINQFNSKSKFNTDQDNGKGITEFMMDEVWDEEEEMVKIIVDKVIEMHDALKEKGYLKEIQGEDLSEYDTLLEISEDPDILETLDNYPSDMPDVDKVIKVITDKYIEKFGK